MEKSGAMFMDKSIQVSLPNVDTNEFIGILPRLDADWILRIFFAILKRSEEGFAML